MPERPRPIPTYPIMAGTSLIPVGVKAGIKISGKDKPIPDTGIGYGELAAEAIAAVLGSLGTFVVKKPEYKALAAGVGVGGIVLTVNDIVQEYGVPVAAKQVSGAPAGEPSSLDEYMRARYGL